MLRVYGSRISYYCGKLEAYLRYRKQGYELLSMVDHAREILDGAGAVQSPVVRLEDGRWISDSTPILAWFESRRSGTTIYPENPTMRFIALLLEDHADEWLWRPAMHYRWSYRQSREYASATLADELLSGTKAPRSIKRMMIARRQRGGFVRNDGVTKKTVGHVERTAMRSFDQLEAIFSLRPFLLGQRPTIADFGFMGPMFRHFAMDPTPAEIMRERAPKTYAWVARMWALPHDLTEGALLAAPDRALQALIREACETHLVQLRGNAEAFAKGQDHFDQAIQGCAYEKLPVSRYRVWCLEELRREWAALEPTAQAAVRLHLDEDTASVLWDSDPAADSGYDPDRSAPFNKAINVFGSGVPS